MKNQMQVSDLRKWGSMVHCISILCLCIYIYIYTYTHTHTHTHTHTDINNIAAVGVDAFYATNDHTSDETLLLTLALPMNDTNVIFYNYNKASVVAHGVGMANGINLSPDGRHVYVADTLNKEIKVMNRKEDNSLSLEKVIKLHVHPDNIEVDQATGSLWVGCLPNIWPLVFYGNYPFIATTIYSNNGSELQSSSVAAIRGSHLLIGTVFHRMMRCTLPIIPLEC
uniref:Paraoxonase n=1 Tax=Eptatretus burgeri TaxID=7764 RepID=A0A8C4R8K5_EPTBU